MARKRSINARKVWELKKKNFTIREICLSLGASHSQVYSCVNPKTEILKSEYKKWQNENLT